MGHKIKIHDNLKFFVSWHKSCYFKTFFRGKKVNFDIMTRLCYQCSGESCHQGRKPHGPKRYGVWPSASPTQTQKYTLGKVATLRALTDSVKQVLSAIEIYLPSYDMYKNIIRWNINSIQIILLVNFLMTPKGTQVWDHHN